MGRERTGHDAGTTSTLVPVEHASAPDQASRPDAPLPGGLTREQVEQLGRELDAIRQDVIDSRGARDAAYIRRLIKVQRTLELGSRLLLLKSRNRKMRALGTAGLAVAKILDNMEIGHNVLHGQWDWMRDPKIHSTTWDWDHASPPEQWKRAHNEVHHRYTNILGRDNDLGYGIMRVDEAQEWKPRHLVQPAATSRRASRSSRSRSSTRTRAAASGTSGRCSGRPTSAGRRRCT